MTEKISTIVSMSTASTSRSAKASPAAYGVALLLIVFVGNINELIPSLQSLHMGKVAVVLSLILYVNSPREKSPVSLFSFPQMRYYWGIVFLAFLSVPGGVWPGHSVDFLKGGFVNSIVFFMLIAMAVRSLDDLKVVFWGYFASIAALTMASMLAWGMPRIFIGNSYDPNDLALLMVMALPLFIYALEEVSATGKMAIIGLVGLILLTVIKTMSRGGFLGLLTVASVLVLKEWKRNTGKIVLAGIVIGVFFSFFASEEFVARMETITSSTDDYNKTADYGRLAHWGRSITLIKENPWLGNGIANAADAAGRRFSYLSRYAWETSHNSFLQIGVEIGVGGVILFTLIIVSSIKHLRSIRNLARSQIGDLQRVVWWSNGLEVGFYGYLVSGFFLSQAYFNPLYFYVAMTIVLERIVQNTIQASR